MQNTVNHRVKVLYEKSGFSYRKYAAVLNISDTHLKNIINSGVTPGSEILQKITDAHPEVNPNWLLTGEGDMLKASENEKMAFNQLVEELHKKDDMIDRLMAMLEQAIKSSSQLAKPKGNSGALRVLKVA